MATITGIDRRRTDIREITQYSPVWVSSGVLNFADIVSKAAVVQSFPVAGGDYVVHAVAVEVLTALTSTGTAAINAGVGTIADDVTPTTVTYSALDDYVADATVTEATLGMQMGKDLAGGNLIKGAASTTPCIFVKGDAGANGGTFKFHWLISRLP